MQNIATIAADRIWSVFMQDVVPLVERDFVWSRICKRIVTGVPDRCLESVVEPLLCKASWCVYYSVVLEPLS